MHRLPFRFLLSLPLCAPLYAQWSDDPATNLAIADRSGAQVRPKIAARADGGSYVGWLDGSSGNYNVYLQRLDSIGVELWPHDGVLISDKPSPSSLVDWDLIADSSGHCVLVFSDARAGQDLDVYAYRIDPDGHSEWGASGVRLSANDDYEPSPTVAETSDGSFVFAWARMPSASTGSIRIQKLDALGLPQFPIEGIAIDGAPGEHPGFCDIVAADHGAFIVAWVRDVSNATSPRHVRAQKFDAGGNALWGGGTPITIYDATSVPIDYQPVLRSDGIGGALFAWDSSSASSFDSFVQHVAANGVELFPHQGVQVSTESGKNKVDPSLSYVAPTHETIVFWSKRDPNRTQWGIGAQKISAAGAREWTDNGIDVAAFDTVFKSSPRSVPVGSGAEVFFFDEPNPPSHLARTLAQRVDGGGHLVFGANPVAVCSALSIKDDLAVASVDGRSTALVWQDARNDVGDVYGQNLYPDGSIGITCYTEVICTSAPNSVGPGSVISWTGSLSIQTNTFTLHSTGSPPNVAGFFYYGPDTVPVPFGDGFQCIGGHLSRLGPALMTDAQGSASRLLDFPSPPASAGPGLIQPIVTVFAQWYYRDEFGPGGSGFNLSNSLELQFCP